MNATVGRMDRHFMPGEKDAFCNSISGLGSLCRTLRLLTNMKPVSLPGLN
jgi:hypothetical protein